MSALGQCVGRVPIATRGNKPGHTLGALCAAFRFACMWDSTLDVTLNGTDASGLGDQMPRYPRRWLGVAMDLSQGTASAQPLATGAPSYGGYQSLAFTSGSFDQLMRTNTSLVDSNNVTCLIIARVRAATGLSLVSNVTPFTSGFDLERSGGASVNFRPFPAGNNIIGSYGTSLPMAWVFLSPFNDVPLCTTNGAAYVVGASARTVAAAGGSQLAIGDVPGTGAGPIDMDWLFTAIAQYQISPAVGVVLAFCAKNKYGG